MDKLYLVIIQEPAREVKSRESKSVLEGEKHHNLFGVWCGNIFSSYRAPLHHGPLGEKVIRDEFAYFISICDGRLEKVRMRGCHW
jgi:hypothetical protein